MSRRWPAIITSTTVVFRLKYQEQTAVTEYRHAVHHTQITRHNGHVWHLAIAVSFEIPDAARQTTTYIADRHGGPAWAVVRGGLRGCDFNTSPSPHDLL